MAGFSPQDLFGGINFEDIFGGLNFDFGGGWFDRFFRRRAGPPRGENLEVHLTVPLQRVLTGGTEEVRITRPQTCTSCKGSGAKPGTAPRTCTTCGGTGQQKRSRSEGKGNVLIQQITTCPVCSGKGAIIEHPCPQCGGSGVMEREETLTVNIPVGVEEGMALRIPGHGMPAPVPNGVAGDLFVVVRSAPDPRFQRSGADLYCEETIEVADAVLGTTITVPTLEAPEKVSIPPATQPGGMVRLKGKGLPEFGGSRRGDFYLRIGVRIPDRLSASERALYEQLRALQHSRSSPTVH